MAENKEVKRLNYFTSQFLQEDDFNDEQAYHIRMRRLHNRALHTWGVVEGLVVSLVQGSKSVAITPGTAIDNVGKEIVLPSDPAPQPIDLSTVTKGTDVFITIAYNEVDDPADKYTTAGVEGKYKRKTERPLLKPDASPLNDGSVIILAKVSVDINSNVGNPDNTVRRLASAALAPAADLEVRSLKWGNNSRLQVDQGGSIELGGDKDTPGTGTPYIDFHFSGKTEDFNTRIINDADGRLSLQAPVVRATGSVGIGTPTPLTQLHIRKDAVGALGPIITLLNGGGSAGAGASIDFDGYDTAANAPSLRIQSLDDGSFSSHLSISTKKAGAATNSLEERLRITSSGNVGIGTAGAAPAAKLQVAGGAIMPAIGNSEQSGIQFPPDPGVGTGDRAFIRYYVESGTETTKLMIGVANDSDDAIGFTQFGAERMTIFNGNVGIGITTPSEKLQIEAGSVFVNGESTGVIVDAAGNKRVGLVKYPGREGGIWRLNAQKFEIGRVNPEVTALPGTPTAFTTDLYIGANGNVGIGTGTAAPAAKLQVAGGAIMPAAGATEASGILFPKDPGGGSGDAAWIRYYARTGPAEAPSLENTTLEIGTSNDPQDHIALMASGNVGIGTATPEGKLQLLNAAQDANGNTLIIGPTSGANLRLGYHTDYSWIQSHGSKPLQINPLGNSVGVGPVVMPGAQGRFMVSGGGAEVGFIRRNLAAWPAQPVAGDRFLWYNQDGGNARLWTEVVGDLLTVNTVGDLAITGALRAGGSDIYFTKTDHNHTGIGNAPGNAAIENDAQNYNCLMILGRNIGTAQAVDRRVKVWDQLEVAGNFGNHGFTSAPKKAGWGGGVHTWDVEAEGTIWSAHGIDTTPHDIAENYLSDSDLAPGDVVCLDKGRDRIVQSEKPNDVLLIGVISTEPGMLLNAMHAEEDSVPGMLPYPVALCGRVPCKVTDENGPIERGDLLTTSSTPGHAMKATPVRVEGVDVYRPGTVIGKALERHKSRKGMIEVFVALR